MAGIQTSAGSSIAISATLPATFDAAGFAALTFSEIGLVDNIGSFGREYNLVTFNPVKTRATLKFKGSYNSGTLQVTAALNGNDAGQVIAQAAAVSDMDYSFRVTLQDGDIYYFIGKVMGRPVEVGGVDSITMTTFNLEVSADALTGNDFVEVLIA